MNKAQTYLARVQEVADQRRSVLTELDQAKESMHSSADVLRRARRAHRDREALVNRLEDRLEELVMPAADTLEP